MRLRALIVGALLFGCGKKEDCTHELEPAARAEGSDEAFEGYDAAGCVPDEAAWAAVEPVVTEHCGSCHGAEPAFGAPLSLVDYDAMLEGIPGTRPVDRIARRAASRTMPPASAPEVPHPDLDQLVAWATCGEVHPDPSVGLQVNRPVWDAVVPENVTLPSFDVAMDGFAVSPDTLDHYHCLGVEVPIDEPRLVRRLQVVLDDARVLHHVRLMRDSQGSASMGAFDCDDGEGGASEQLWAWAPGTGAFDFDDGGLRIEPGDRLVVEIHYNNGAGLSGVVDHSGIRVFHGPEEGTVWTVAETGPSEFELPEGESAVCSRIEVDGTARILAGMPHMHELGQELHAWISRGKKDPGESLIDLTGWNFEAQRTYRLDTTVEKGDVLETWCGFRNETGETVVSGLGTSDEMCFHYLFVTNP